MIKGNLSRILGERRMTRNELAKQAGVAINTVLALYHETGKGITFETMDRICTALDVQPGDLFTYTPGAPTAGCKQER